MGQHGSNQLVSRICAATLLADENSSLADIHHNSVSNDGTCLRPYLAIFNCQNGLDPNACSSGGMLLLAYHLLQGCWLGVGRRIDSAAIQPSKVENWREGISVTIAPL